MLLSDRRPARAGGRAPSRPRRRQVVRPDRPARMRKRSRTSRSASRTTWTVERASSRPRRAPRPATGGSARPGGTPRRRRRSRRCGRGRRSAGPTSERNALARTACRGTAPSRTARVSRLMTRPPISRSRPARTSVVVSVVAPAAHHHVPARLDLRRAADQLVRRVGEVGVGERDGAAGGREHPGPDRGALAPVAREADDLVGPGGAAAAAVSSGEPSSTTTISSPPSLADDLELLAQSPHGLTDPFGLAEGRHDDARAAPSPGEVGRWTRWPRSNRTRRCATRRSRNRLATTAASSATPRVRCSRRRSITASAIRPGRSAEPALGCAPRATSGSSVERAGRSGPTAPRSADSPTVTSATGSRMTEAGSNSATGTDPWLEAVGSARGGVAGGGGGATAPDPVGSRSRSPSAVRRGDRVGLPTGPPPPKG